MSIDFDRWEDDLRASGLSDELLERKLEELHEMRKRVEALNEAGIDVKEVPYTPLPQPAKIDLKSLLLGVSAGALAGTAVGAAGAYYLRKGGGA